MLSRSGSNASDALRRSKSSSSVRERRKHPLSSESIDPETARIHALIAAHRAMDRAQGYRAEGPSRHNNSSDISSLTMRQIPHLQHSPASELRRQRSILHAKTPSLTGTSSYTGARLCDNFETDTTYIDKNSEIGENYETQPSSYRRLHRARSMLTPRRQWQQVHISGTRTPLSQARTLRHAASTINTEGSNLGLRLRRSLNFLRAPGFSAFPPNQPHSDVSPRPEAVQLARDQFLRSLQGSNHPQILSQPFRSRVRTTHKSFRKSLRTPHHDGKFDLHDESPIVQISPPLRKMRSISVSLRNRFRRVFSKPKLNSEQLPPQQLNSLRPHYITEAEDQQNMGLDSYNADNTANSRRNSFFVPASDDQCSPEEVVGLLQAAASNGSQASIASNTRSRVTSWTNSTVTGSLHENGPDCKRLSVIKEDGSPHQPSSSAGRHLGGVPIFEQPLKAHSGNKPDSQRLYSALMKQIDQGKPTFENLGATKDQARGRTSVRLKPDIHEKSTIRSVPSQHSIATLAPDAEHREFSFNISSWPQNSGMTPEKLSDNLKRRRRLLKIQEAQSSFFPHSSENKPEATSPFRKLLIAKRGAEQGDGDSPCSEDEREGEVHNTNCLFGNRRDLSSESVYSRTTHGGTNPYYDPPIASAEDLGTQEEVADTGFATIMPARSRNQLSEQQQERAHTSSSTASTSKADWKGWMENRISKLRPSSSKNNQHLREHAQISPAESNYMLGEGLPADYANSTQIQGHFQNRFSDTIRTQSPSTKSPEQLSVRKRRSPLVAVEVMNRNTVTPGQSELLADSIESNKPGADRSTGSESKIFGTTLRKISQGNIAQLLRGKKSLPSTQLHHTMRKENRPRAGATTPIDSVVEHQNLQVRSGNNTSKLRDQENFVDFENRHASTGTICKLTESPTDRLKATLSARLSRPFDMETPEYNRPFDSMYLGKREMGFSDNIGGRLSVAPSATLSATHPSGPRGYGGLGTPILSRPVRPMRDDETTALPHFPTPEDDAKKGGKKLGMALRSNRMVSNFLRSRRRNSDKDNNEDGSQDETEVK